MIPDAELVGAADRLVDGDGAEVFIRDGRDEVGGRPVMRTFRALQVALVIEWVALALKWWGLAGLMAAPFVVALGVRSWVEWQTNPAKARGPPTRSVCRRALPGRTLTARLC